jgi:hypothetical protein
MKIKIPRQYSMVKFNFKRLPAKYHSRYPFTRDDVFIFFGEIPNMPGHCVVSNHKTGQIFSGYHTDNFTEIKEDE